MHEEESLRRPTVQAAIADLPTINTSQYDYLFESDLFHGELGQPSLYASRMRQQRSDSSISGRGLSGFLKTRHSDEVVKRFAATRQGERESISRFMRLAWDGLAPTLRAGTIRGRGQFMAPRPIHPDEPRVITVREAARLHSFPDWFTFYPTKWYGFMQIGNSVPPLMAQAVGTSLLEVLS
jgi:DNA (cytosine-5)-methyltransferase 1